jgi:hypothetical protein
MTEDSTIHDPSGKIPARDAPGVITLSDSAAQRLVQSTGNLYWTSNGAVFGDGGASIYRASKSNVPGQETLLYSEAVTPQTYGNGNQFSALTWAKIGDGWYGYFVANYPDPGMSQIKRVSLAGGEATVLVNSPAQINHGDLVTDGSHLCWADAEGIRSMPISGGPVTTLVAGTTFARLAMYGSTVYYMSGTSVLSVPVTGGNVTTAVSAGSPVTAFSVATATIEVELEPEPGRQGLGFTGAEVFWGQADGAVNRLATGHVTQYQAPSPDLTVTCVSSTQSRVMWADLYVGPQGTECRVRMSAGGQTTTMFSDNAEFALDDVQADSDAVYWPEVFVYKYPF